MSPTTNQTPNESRKLLTFLLPMARAGSESMSTCVGTHVPLVGVATIFLSKSMIATISAPQNRVCVLLLLLLRWPSLKAPFASVIRLSVIRRIKMRFYATINHILFSRCPRRFESFGLDWSQCLSLRAGSFFLFPFVLPPAFSLLLPRSVLYFTAPVPPCPSCYLLSRRQLQQLLSNL
jgi:hypothetical protein